MKVLTDTGLAYYHSKLQDEFVSQDSLSSTIDTYLDDYLDNVDWTNVLGNTYVTQEDVEDMISSADLDNYLPLSGGTMTGEIMFSAGGVAIRKSTDDSMLTIAGGSDITHGAFLRLYGTDYVTNQGSFSLATPNNKVLQGNTDGTLTWDGNKVASFDSNNKLVFPNGDTLWFA